MKKAFKTIFIYFGVLLLALIATIIFCLGFLFFYRDGNIFGVKYVKINQVIYAHESADMSNLQNIEIRSSAYDVNVKLYSNMDQLAGAMRNKIFGYTHKSKAQAKFELPNGHILV